MNSSQSLSVFASEGQGTAERERLAGGAGATGCEYIDLGMDFDVRHVNESGDFLSFGLRAEISSIASSVSEASSPLRGKPVIRQNSWDSMVKIPIGKPTVVSSADDLDSKGKLQVEVTATRIE